MSQQLCLKWNRHVNNMVDAFKNLLSSEEMVDVTLACGGRCLKAHKIVLSASSPFFRSLFLENPCKHPIVILKDVKFEELKAVVEFMYHGEINVAEEELSAFMEAAGALGVKGLLLENNSIRISDVFSLDTEQSINASPERRKKPKRKRSASNKNNGVNSEKQTLPPNSPEIEEIIYDKEADRRMYSHIPSSPAMQTPSSLKKRSFNKQSQQHQEQHLMQGTGDKFPPIKNFRGELSNFVDGTLEKDYTTNCLDETCVQTCMPSAEIQTCKSSDHPAGFVPIFMSPDAPTSAIQPECSTGTTLDSLHFVPLMSQSPESSHLIEGNFMGMQMDQISMPDLCVRNDCEGNSSVLSGHLDPLYSVLNFETSVMDTRNISPVLPKYDKKDKNCLRSKRLTCPYCSFSTAYVTSLKNHVRIHTGEKPYTCKFCDKRFAGSANLRTHMRVHTGEKPYVCKFCDKRFSESCNLHTHMRTHTGEKPYECCICKKRFAESSNLRIHMRIHTGEKPYECSVCHKKFTQNSGLKNHFTNRHT